MLSVAPCFPGIIVPVVIVPVGTAQPTVAGHHP